MTVFGLGVEDGTHTGRETSEAKKTGLPVTKELSEESLSSANTGGKGSALQQWEPCRGCGDHRNAPGGREKLRKTASITLEEQAPSTLLLALCFHTSSFLPALGTAASSSPSPASSSKRPVGAADPLHTFKPNREENGAFSELSSTSTTQTLPPPAAPAPEDPGESW